MADAGSSTQTDSSAASRQAFASLTKRERNRVMASAVLRMMLSIGLLVIIYVITPPDDLAKGTLGIGLMLGVILLVVLIAWELHRTMNDPYPEVRAATALLVLVTAVVVVFALSYAAISAANTESFTEPLSKGDAIYFTVTTLSTTGFGDITAVSTAARWVVTGQMLFDLVLLVGLARVFMLAAKVSRARQSRAADAK
jgi:hypothetical protein